MIGFDAVVGVLLEDMARGGQQLVEHSRVGGCPVGSDLTRVRAALQGVGEEPAGGRQLPLFGRQHVDDLAELVDRPLQIGPASSHFDVGLVHEPPIPAGTSTGPRRVDQQQSKSLHPPEDRDGGQASFIDHGMTWQDVAWAAVLGVRGPSSCSELCSAVHGEGGARVLARVSGSQTWGLYPTPWGRGGLYPGRSPG
jgi:hypothetical protein